MLIIKVNYSLNVKRDFGKVLAIVIEITCDNLMELG